MPHWRCGFARWSSSVLWGFRCVCDTVGGRRVRRSLGDRIGALCPCLLGGRFPVAVAWLAMHLWTRKRIDAAGCTWTGRWACGEKSIGGLRGCTVSLCERGHVAPTDATAHERSPRSSRSVARQDNVASRADVMGEQTQEAGCGWE
jgi:hypothetical protein